MKLIGVTQRVEINNDYAERRDSLDQMWIKLLNKCELMPIILPNNIKSIKNIILSFDINGILLTGGNSLLKYGGDSPERDECERLCIEYCIKNNIPLFGVCRGMQMIQDYFGIALQEVSGHIQKKQIILIDKEKVKVNSYHNYGSFSSGSNLVITAKAFDGVVKGIRHKTKKIQGIMWHPERIYPFEERDIKLLKEFYNR